MGAVTRRIGVRLGVARAEAAFEVDAAAGLTPGHEIDGHIPEGEAVDLIEARLPQALRTNGMGAGNEEAEGRHGNPTRGVGDLRRAGQTAGQDDAVHRQYSLSL